MNETVPAKPFQIAKRVIREACQQVKAKRGAAGSDDETIEMCRQHLSRNLYKLWNRIPSGSYFPPPVLQVEIPKASGGLRKLGIPKCLWRAASELRRKCTTGRSCHATGAVARVFKRFAQTLLASLLGALAPVMAADLPTGGQVVAGSGAISQSGSTMTIRQGTDKMAADWQSFGVGAGHSVNFVQPSASATALNRVLGSDVSVIQGAINANGQVFLVNPNGVLFTPTAQVNVGSIVASTLL